MTIEAEALFDAQIQRELQMNEIGKKDLGKQTKEAEERQYASHTMYGSWARKEYTLQISHALRERFKDVKRGKAMTGASALMLLHEHLNWDRVAYIALSTMLDAAGVPRKYGRLHSNDRKDKALITTSELDFLIAKRIMIEANLQHLRKHFRHKYKEMKEEFFTEHASFQQKVTRIKRKVKGVNKFFDSIAQGTRLDTELTAEKAAELGSLFKWVDWNGATQVQVGSLIARVVNDVTGFFAYTRSFDEKGKDRNIFVFSSVFNEIRDSIMSQSEGYAWFMLPMLCPPKRWSKDELGGYRFGARAFYKDIVRGHREGTEISPTTYKFINSQQDVGFRIDKEVLEVQRFLAEKGWSILGENDEDEDCKDSFRPYMAPEKHEMPSLSEHLKEVKKPTKDSTNAEHKARYDEKKQELMVISRFYTRQEELKQLARPVTRYFRLVKHVEDDLIFYFPWSLDWRGRCYPMVDALNPQGPEYQKAVLNFAELTPVDSRTEYWLKVGIGSAAGQDKESFESRVAWTNANIKLVKAVGNDPLGAGFKTWTSMPEPWIFLRACIEYRRIFQEGQQHTDMSCLGMDATQSGLQLLGGMVLCHQTCDLVNCVPGHDKPQDAYGTVLAEAIRLMEVEGSAFPIEKIKGKRKLVKTPVMTKVYAAGHGTRLSQIRRALQKEGIRLARAGDRNEELIEYFTCKVEEAMINTIPGVDLILDWFQKVVKTAFERGVEDIVFETPSGNRITVEYRKALTKRIDTESLGNAVCTPVKKVDRERHLVSTGKGETEEEDVIRAIAANFTHGAGDATLLHLAFSDVETPVFASTHDCVYSPPSSIVDDNHIRVREAFVKICKSGCLEKFALLNKCPDIPPPIVGTYKPESVRYARYFFC